MEELFYAPDGKKIYDTLFWARIRREGSEASWVVGRTRIGNLEVSTVWLGIDHGFMTDEVLIFETMIFSSDPNLDTLCWRYENWYQALCGHLQLVAASRAERELPA